ncbi:MAG TPA: putative Ig domain-containing protein [Patescibacteria group bacterium]|nr:putative Ig domain-containing protein [Patescibacteria group bacterium]
MTKTKKLIAIFVVSTAALAPALPAFAQEVLAETVAVPVTTTVQTKVTLKSSFDIMTAPWVVGSNQQINFEVYPQVPETYTLGVFLKDYYTGTEGLVSLLSPIPSTGNFNFAVPKLVIAEGQAVQLISSKYYVVLKLYNGKPCLADCTSGAVPSGSSAVNIIYKDTSVNPVTIFANASDKFFVRPVGNIDGEVAKPYSKMVEVVGMQGPFTWSVNAGALPAGVKLVSYPTPPAIYAKYCPGGDCAAFGRNITLMRGTPTQAGSFSATVTATDSLGNTASVPVTITIAAKGTTGDMQYGTVMKGYRVIKLDVDSTLYIITPAGEKIALHSPLAAKPYKIKPENIKVVDLLEFLSIPDAQYMRLHTSRTIYMIDNGKRRVMYPAAISRAGITWRQVPETYHNHFYSFPDGGGVR